MQVPVLRQAIPRGYHLSVHRDSATVIGGIKDVKTAQLFMVPDEVTESEEALLSYIEEHEARGDFISVLDVVRTYERTHDNRGEGEQAIPEHEKR